MPCMKERQKKTKEAEVTAYQSVDNVTSSLIDPFQGAFLHDANKPH